MKKSALVLLVSAVLVGVLGCSEQEAAYQRSEAEGGYIGKVVAVTAVPGGGLMVTFDDGQAYLLAESEQTAQVGATYRVFFDRTYGGFRLTRNVTPSKTGE